MLVSEFLKNNTFIIDEKVGLFKFGNAYTIYDADGNNIGCIQENVSTFHKVLSFLVDKKNMPFQLDIKDAEGNVLASISRGWSFFMSKITVKDANGDAIATIKQKFNLKLKFEIKDMLNNKIGAIEGKWTSFNFDITDENDQKIGMVSKQLKGMVMKELFTSADKYAVNINADVTDPNKRMSLIVAAATIDMVGHE